MRFHSKDFCFKGRSRPVSGFTLIEVATVIVIVGLLLVGFVRFIDVQSKQQRISNLKTGTADLDKAVADFVATNGRLPCPAPVDLAPGDPAFGREVPCDGAAHAGTTEVDGRSEGGVPLKVRIGSIPTRTLAIADRMMLDPYYRRFTYAVTEALADVDATGNAKKANDPSGGAITIKDETGTVVTSMADYVLFSHGKDGKGAYTLEGVQFQGCDSGSIDSENCDDANAVFATTIQTSEAANALHFDDYMLYRKDALATEGHDCPDGFVALGKLGCIEENAEPDSKDCVQAVQACFSRYEGRLPSYSERLAAYLNIPALAVSQPEWIDDLTVVPSESSVAGNGGQTGSAVVAMHSGGDNSGVSVDRQDEKNADGSSSHTTEMHLNGVEVSRQVTANADGSSSVTGGISTGCSNYSNQTTMNADGSVSVTKSIDNDCAVAAAGGSGSTTSQQSSCMTFQANFSPNSVGASTSSTQNRYRCFIPF